MEMDLKKNFFNRFEKFNSIIDLINIYKLQQKE